MPSIEGGGVEKNLIIISNYFAKKIKNMLTSKNKLQKETQQKTLT